MALNLGFRAGDLGFEVYDLRFGACDLRFKVYASGFRVDKDVRVDDLQNEGSGGYDVGGVAMIFGVTAV